MIFVLTIINHVNDIVRTKVICHYSLLVTHYLLLGIQTPKTFCYNLQWLTSFYNQFATSLLTTCNRLIANKLSQAMRTHPDISLLLTSLFQDVNKLVGTCAFLTVYPSMIHQITMSHSLFFQPKIPNPTSKNTQRKRLTSARNKCSLASFV